MLFLSILFCVNTFGQTDIDSANFDRLFGGEPPTIPLDSIIKKEIKNQKIIGYWKFSNIKVDKEDTKFYDNLSKKKIFEKYDSILIGFEFKNNHQAIIHKKTTNKKFYWAVSENQDTILTYYLQDTTEYRLNAYGFSFPIKKLTRNKLIIDFNYEFNDKKSKQTYLIKTSLIFKKRRRMSF